jgi:putative Holliday junction resolvase
MRVLGVDFGERRVGLAISDPTGTLASPLPTLQRRRGKKPPLRAMAEVAQEQGAEALVFGLPLSPRGDDTDWTREVRWVGRALSDQLGVPIHFLDERFTSALAERHIRGLGLKKSRREAKGLVDAAAAVIILQTWLDRGSDPDPGTGRDADSGDDLT